MQRLKHAVLMDNNDMFRLSLILGVIQILFGMVLTRLEELRDITRAFFDNGMSMEVDLKRVNINLDNLKVQYDNAQAMMKQQLNMLKYIMDYPAEKEIALTPVNTDKIHSIRKASEVRNTEPILCRLRISSSKRRTARLRRLLQ